MAKFVALILLLPLFSFSQVINSRQYRPGETFRYKLTTESYRNDQSSGKSISISQHTVVQDTGFLSEEIRWLSKISFGPKDTIHLDSIAQKIPPYRITLSPKGEVLLPKLKVPEMVGDITDLNTFYVAIAPALNAQKLSQANKTILNKDLIKGNFADGSLILYGMDCMEVSQHLVSTGKNYTVIETRFAPPASLCLAPLIDTIGKQTFEYPANFQMKQKSAREKVNLLWGNESFTITTKIDTRNGQIMEASMINTLKLRMRYNASPDLATYAAELPITIKRILKLELLQ